MKLIIVCGISGSGKTTSVIELAKYLAGIGRKIAIILTEKGEVELNDETIADSGIVVEEVISDCVPCSLRFNVENALKNATEESNPDVVIIELLSSASPLQIKESLEPMNIPYLSFAPIVNIVDSSNFSTEIEKLPKFVITQIKESGILCINKMDVGNNDRVDSIEILLKQINPDARIFRFSARGEDEAFQEFLKALKIGGE